jgi:peroxiredoxin
MLPSVEALEGKPVPRGTFKACPNGQWRDVTTDELFKGKTVVVFALPGAAYFAPRVENAAAPAGFK